MSIPEASSSRPSPRPAAGIAPWMAFAVLLLGGIWSAGCTGKNKSNLNAGPEGGEAVIDARGSSVDSEIYMDQRTVLNGAGGNGGTVRITSSGGDVLVDSDMLPEDQTAIDGVIAGIVTITGDIFVGPGQSLMLSGGYVCNRFHVEAGGEVILINNTYIDATGYAYIAGNIRCKPETGVIRRDGSNFALSAGGAVVITGKVDVSGTNATKQAASREEPNTDDPREKDEIAGNGGEVFISTGGNIIITGEVRANGGASDIQYAPKGAGGMAGQIFFGTSADPATAIIYGASRPANLFFAGKLSARAGNSYTNDFSDGPIGGTIELISLGPVVLKNTPTINVEGGRSSGVKGGAGGIVQIESPIGDTTLEIVDISANGGRLFFTSAGTAGAGGSVSLSGRVLTLTGIHIDTNGGDVVDEEKRGTTGEGGPGGSVTLSGTSLIDADAGVGITAMGGDSNGIVYEGGAGGNFAAIASTGAPVVVYYGFLNVKGGNTYGGSETASGTVCVSYPADAETLAQIIGINEYPIGSCGSDSYGAFKTVVHDLDCNDATIRPDSNEVQLPAVLGVDFYRVYVGAATGVTISTTGETGRDLDLYVGASTRLGNTSTAAGIYPHQSVTGGDSSETVTIDGSSSPSLAALRGADGFVSVMVRESSSIVETYTITVTCTD